MKLHELFEQIDQTEAEEVYQAMRANNDPAAKYFLTTRNDPRHTTVDSAQRAAERMARADMMKKSKAEREKMERERELSLQKAKQKIKKEPKAKAKAGFTGPDISLDKAKDAIKGPLGAVQKAWQRGTKIADKYTKARKS